MLDLDLIHPSVISLGPILSRPLRTELTLIVSHKSRSINPSVFKVPQNLFTFLSISGLTGSESRGAAPPHLTVRPT